MLLKMFIFFTVYVWCALTATLSISSSPTSQCVSLNVAGKFERRAAANVAELDPKM